MARSKEGFFGRLSGKIGPVVMATWKGIPYIRSRPTRNTSNSPPQQRQRAMFGLAMDFIKKIRPVINAGFKWNTKEMTEMNSATSYIMKRAIKVTGKQPGDLELDYPSLLISRGELSPPQQADAQIAQDGALHVSWHYDAKQMRGRGDDRGLVLAWCHDLQEGEWAVEDGPLRRDQAFTLELSDTLAGRAVEVYLGFASPDGTDASDSVYLGRMEVS